MSHNIDEAGTEQAAVFVECLDIYRDRHLVRGDNWKNPDFTQPEDLTHHMEDKLSRFKIASQQPGSEAMEEARDSLKDLINYAGFAYRWINGEQ